MATGDRNDRDERERLIHDLEVHQAELESQNRQLRETQEMFEQSRARYADLYDFAPVAYCTFDANGVIREINLAGASLLGQERGSLIGRQFIACVSMTDELAFVHHLRECMAGPGRCTTEITLLQPGGEALVLQVATAPYSEADGAARGCRSALTDITARKKAEDALHLAVRMREDFLAIVSHDLRNPLSSISMSADLLLKRVPAPERRLLGRAQLEIIVRAVKRMTRLVNDLLDLSSMEAGHLSMQRGIHDLRDLVATAVEIVSPLALEKSIRLEANLLPEPLPADCDRERIIQVLVNLLGNAIKFTPNGGTVTAEARAVGDGVLCAVRDTGIGITDEQRRHLFEPYWQAQRSNLHKSAGLGLSIAKGIVEFHRGKIWVDSGPLGSTFMFTLPGPTADQRPVTRPRLPSDATLPPKRLPTKSGEEALGNTILIVDDEADARTSLMEILVDEGYRVLTAGNGQEALDCLRRNEEQPALILLDLVMPVMDGWTFLRERARDLRLATTPVILISGQANAHQIASELGLAGIIEKPIDMAKLILAVGELMKSTALPLAGGHSEGR